MSSPIVSILSIFFTSSILISISLPCNMAASPSSPTLLRFACSNDSMIIDTESCLRVLESIPKVVAAKDLFNLSIAIIKSGISNSTSTRRHLETALNQTKDAGEECKLAYDQVVSRFTTALREVKRFEYVAPTYDLKTASTDYVQGCDVALAKENVTDAIISQGNRVVPILGISAFTVVAELESRSESPPPTLPH